MRLDDAYPSLRRFSLAAFIGCVTIGSLILLTAGSVAQSPPSDFRNGLRTTNVPYGGNGLRAGVPTATARSTAPVAATPSSTAPSAATHDSDRYRYAPAGSAAPIPTAIATPTSGVGAVSTPPGSTARLRIGGSPDAPPEQGRSQLQIRQPPPPPAAVVVPTAPTMIAPVRPAAMPTSTGSLTSQPSPTVAPNGAVFVSDDGSLSDSSTAPTSTAATPRTTVDVPRVLPPNEPAAVTQSPIAAPTAIASDAARATPATPPGTPLALEPVDFNGVLLGESTAADVRAAWGAPQSEQTQDGVLHMTFALEPFKSVETTFVNGRASNIIIDLGEFFPAPSVAQELGLDGSSSVPIEDDAGRVLGIVFPEQGVSFRFDGDGREQLVAQIGLDVIDPRPFVLRAERSLDSDLGSALTDVATALKLNPFTPRAHYIRAQVLKQIGRRREALEAAEAALKLEPKNLECLLVRAELLAEAGMFDAALVDNKAVIENATNALPWQARAWCQRGDLLAGGPERDYTAAADAHTRAIRLAEPLANDARRSVRRTARGVLVDAHLALAQDIAWGNWQQKETTVTLWLGRGEKLAREAVEQGELPPDTMLKVYQQGLAANVGLQGAADPRAWAERLQKSAEAAVAGCNDPLRRRRIQYEAGLGLYDALQALHARGQIDDALQFGRAAVEMVQAGREGRDESPVDGYRYGRLYFRVGSLYAVNRNDHAGAIEWFDRAAPLLELPLPDAAAADRGRQGETLVSMGISYWAVGKRERGLQLTETGMRYMQSATDEGNLAAAAMSVPFANLATMHQQLGDAAAGKKYAEMASRVEAPSDGTMRR